MRRTKATALAALATTCVAIAAWAAAPALAGGRYVPDPVEFEAAVPTAVALGPPARRAARRAVSPVVRSGRRFNLLGLSWRGGRIESLSVRVRRDGGAWSRWVAVGTGSEDAPDRRSREHRRARRGSNPVWAGEADEVQLTLSGSGDARDLRLRFVNTTGTATPGARMRTRLHAIASGAVAAVRRVAGVDTAQADTSQPAIVPREQWASDKCPPRADPVYGSVKLAFIHHTVSANEYGPEDSAAMVLAICRYHRNGNGWNDIGYNFLVDRYGTIFEGRAGGIADAVIGAQAQGYNSNSTGIASLGTFSTGGQTPAGLGAIARLLSWKLAVHGVPPNGKVDVISQGGTTNRYPSGSRPVFNRISGHRDGNATACPGSGLYAQIPQLRAMVNPGPPRASTQTIASRQRRNIPYGSKAGLRVSLAVGGVPPGSPASPLSAKRVDVQVLGRLGWRTNHSVTTDSAGNAETQMRLSLNRRLRARFPGEPGLLPSSSAILQVGVRPVLTLAAKAEGKRVRITGTVRPKKATAILTLKRRTAAGRLVRVSRRTVTLRSGNLLTSLRVVRPALYRLRLSVLSDTRNLSARSDVTEFRVR
jgi:hypothetical protein